MNEQIHESDADNFKDAVSTGDVLVDFWAPWCAPCRTLKPHLEALSKERPQLKILMVNVDDFPDLAEELGIRSMPTLVLFRSGAEAKRRAGALSKAALADFVGDAGQQ